MAVELEHDVVANSLLAEVHERGWVALDEKREAANDGKDVLVLDFSQLGSGSTSSFEGVGR